MECNQSFDFIAFDGVGDLKCAGEIFRHKTNLPDVALERGQRVEFRLVPSRLPGKPDRQGSLASSTRPPRPLEIGYGRMTTHESPARGGAKACVWESLFFCRKHSNYADSQQQKRPAASAVSRSPPKPLNYSNAAGCLQFAALYGVTRPLIEINRQRQHSQ